MNDEVTQARVGCGPVGAGIVAFGLGICVLLTIGSGLVIAFPHVFIDLADRVFDRQDGEPDRLQVSISPDGIPIIVPDATAELGTISNPAAIGGTVEGGGLAITVHGVTTAASIAEAIPAVGQTYLLLDVTFVNVADDVRSFNSYYWSARDIIGEANYDDEKNVEPSNALLAGSLGPGDQIRGNVLLLVPLDTPVLRLKYSTELLGGEDLYWLFVASSVGATPAATPGGVGSPVSATPAAD